MLTKVQKTPIKPSAGSFAIVASRYNTKYVDSMVRSAQAVLRRAGVRDLKVVRVPGAFEIPVVAARLAQSHLPRLAGILCFGVVIQGETAHARHVTDAVTMALARLQVDALIPVIDGVYLFNNEDQARVRCLGRQHNRGVEVAQTALAMAEVMRGL